MKNKPEILFTLLVLVSVLWVGEVAWGGVLLKSGRAVIDTSRSSHEDSLPVVWPRQTAYTFTDSAESLFVSLRGSTENLTAIEGIEVIGLDGSWDKKSVTIDRNDMPKGDPAARIAKIGTNTWRRVNRVKVLGDTVNLDTLYVLASRTISAQGAPSTASHVRSIVPPRVGRDVQMIYTVPDGKKGKILRASLFPSFSTADSAEPSDSAIVDLLVRIREENGIFQTFDMARASSQKNDFPPISLVYPNFPQLNARTDILIAAGVTSSASFIELRGMLIVEEN